VLGRVVGGRWQRVVVGVWEVYVGAAVPVEN
jgi:hypothetical protein